MRTKLFATVSLVLLLALSQTAMAANIAFSLSPNVQSICRIGMPHWSRWFSSSHTRLCAYGSISPKPATQNIQGPGLRRSFFSESLSARISPLDWESISRNRFECLRKVSRTASR